MASEVQREREEQRASVVQKGCGTQKAVCEVQKVSYNGQRQEDEALQETHVRWRAKGINDDQKKVSFRNTDKMANTGC
ncbi:hypothetical protein SUGI_0678310 [Cryptomeria japonica]|nr:hypothetical protein SUGI_0678310 [Cryptomeria japonica]